MALTGTLQLTHQFPTLMVSLNRPGFGYEVFWCHNTGRKYLVFLDFWYLDTSFLYTFIKCIWSKHAQNFTMSWQRREWKKLVTSCSVPKCLHYIWVLLSLSTWQIIFRYTVFCFKAISGIRFKRFLQFLGTGILVSYLGILVYFFPTTPFAQACL